ncbi:MAG TPA: response regulator transcription factor [Bacteroidota bacterium]|jgi:two-component system response regulator NreC
MAKIRVFVADDHNIVRRGLISLLSLLEDVEVVGEAEDGRTAVEQVLKIVPDLVLMDVSMPNLNGMEATRRIKNRMPEIRVLVLSAHDNEAYVLESLRSGANGYILKNTSADDLHAAIRVVNSGQAYFSPGISKILAEDYVRRVTDPSNTEAIPPPNGPRLTDREREILQLIAEGLSHQQISDQLHISIRTVDTHRNNIIQKLDIHDAAGLVTYAIKNGIVILNR